MHAALGPDLPPGCLLEAAEGLPVRVLLDRAEGARLLMLGSRRGDPAAGRPAAPARLDRPGVPARRAVPRRGGTPAMRNPASPVAGRVSRDAEPGAGSQDLPEAQPGG